MIGISSRAVAWVDGYVVHAYDLSALAARLAMGGGVPTKDLYWASLGGGRPLVRPRWQPASYQKLMAVYYPRPPAHRKGGDRW